MLIQCQIRESPCVSMANLCACGCKWVRHLSIDAKHVSLCLLEKKSYKLPGCCAAETTRLQEAHYRKKARTRSVWLIVINDAGLINLTHQQEIIFSAGWQPFISAVSKTHIHNMQQRRVPRRPPRALQHIRSGRK